MVRVKTSDSILLEALCEKVKNAGGAPENPIAMADNVSTFTVTNATNEIQIQLNPLSGKW